MAELGFKQGSSFSKPCVPFTIPLSFQLNILTQLDLIFPECSAYTLGLYLHPLVPMHTSHVVIAFPFHAQAMQIC